MPNTNNNINNTVTQGNFSVNQSTSATAVTCTLAHSDNTNVGSTANLIIKTGGTAGGNPFTTYTVNGSASWSTGIDQADSRKYKVSQGTIVGTNASITITPAGLINYPLQCAFSAYLLTSLVNQTGDGTVVGPVKFDTKLYDIGNNYSTSSGLFTAPINGIYYFTVSILYTNAPATDPDSATNVRVNGNSGQPQYSFTNMSLMVTSQADFSFSKSVFVKLNANDTLQVDTNVSLGTKTVGIGGGSPTAGGSAGAVTFFQGYLIA